MDPELLGSASDVAISDCRSSPRRTNLGAVRLATRTNSLRDQLLKTMTDVKNREVSLAGSIESESFPDL